MREPNHTTPADAPYQPAHVIRKRLGIGGNRLERLALTQKVRHKTRLVAFLTFHIEDVKKYLEETGELAQAK
jgi:hypothetical protein